MTEPLGLSIGMTNLVAARVGRPPVTRRSILNLFADRPPQAGAPAEIPGFTEPHLVLDGFVDRVGDPVPLVAADGSAHRGEQVLAQALDAMARLTDGGAPVAIAVPAHWGPGTVGALRGALRSVPSLSADGTPPVLVPDASAALAALRVAAGLPTHGVVVLVDLGGSGSSITLVDAGVGSTPIGQPVRVAELSGDAIDQALLNHVLAGITDTGAADTAGTAAVGPLTALRDECRTAKERLSSETAAVIGVQLPGFTSDIRVTRPELEQLISEPLDALLGTIEDTLQRNGIPATDVSAVATVGGGAAIPLVTQRLSERLRARVSTTPEPALTIATGAALVADQSLAADAATGMAPAADAPTAMGPAAWAAGAAGAAATESAGDGAPSATFRALAWSQDDESAGDPLPYAGEDYTAAGAYTDTGTAAARPPVDFAGTGEVYTDDVAPLPWYKRPSLLFGVAAAAALLAAGGLAVTLTSTDGNSTPVTETATTAPTETSAVELPPPVTTVTVGPDGVATTTVSQPPPPPPADTTTTTTPSTTTTTSPTTTTTTTTTTPPTTTTTRTTTTRPTTTQPPTTTAPPPTTTVEPPPTTVDPPDPITTTVIVPDDGA